MLVLLIYFLLLLPGALAQRPSELAPPADQDQNVATFKSSSNLVLVHLTLKDRGGRPLDQRLTSDNFAVFEDGRQQTVSVCEFQRLSAEVLPPVPSAVTSPPGAKTPPDSNFHDRRLLVLYFDFASMDMGHQSRSVDAALRFLRTQMTLSDTIAIYAYSSDLRLVQDFTADRDRLLDSLRQLKSGASDLTYRDQFTKTGDDVFQLFTAENRLNALEDLAKSLGKFPEKKAIVYISNGGKRTGIENLSQLRATTIAANRANVSFYTVDARGLDASPALGGGGAASGKGADLFTGQGAAKLRLNSLTQQDTMSALALDTGGKMIHDTNDLALGMRSAQSDMSSYYIIGYYSDNPEADGKYRKITIRTKDAPSIQLEYRPGYFAPKIFKLMNGRERDAQLEEAIRLDNPFTDIPIALGPMYFRLDRLNYFVSLSTRIAGSSIPLVNGAGGQETVVDFLGVIEDPNGKAIGRISDKIRLNVTPDLARDLDRRGLQYDTGFRLRPGSYTLKFLVREDQEGKMGTFETPLVIPDLAASPGLHVSSVVWSGQRVAAARSNGKPHETNPLVRGGSQLVPNLTSLFNTGQTLTAFCEAYDLGPSPKISAIVALYRGDQLVQQTPAARSEKALPARPDTVPVKVELSLAAIPPGEYVAQLTIIDEANQKAAFLRKPLIVVAK